jgi:hypothetical protein
MKNVVSILAALCAIAGVSASAQRGRGAVPAGGPPKAAAPIDLTGNWVSVVSEDWLQRMLMPPRGDYAGIPLSLEGRRVANGWEPAMVATDGCKPYGAPALMRIPGRLQVSWENDTTLKIETDAGLQTRLLHFDTSPLREPQGGPDRGRGTTGSASPKTPVADRSWQGYSQAEWEQLIQRGGQGGGLVPPPPRAGAALKVVTTRLKTGYLRKNGVPYSEDTVLTEYFDRLSEEGTEWLVVKTIVSDPKYLAQDFVTSTHFRKEPDNSKWMPSPCEATRGRK